MDEGDTLKDADSGRVLIVDDDEINRETLLDLIHHYDFDIEAAADGRSALEMIGQHDYDVVLLDINMPDMNGFEVLSRIRAKRPPTALPVIMITGLDQRDHVLEALKLGANDYVVKPFDPAVVVARIRTQLSLKRAVDRIVRLERDMEDKNRELERANDELQQAYRHIKSDLEAAAQVQRALLPTSLPVTPGVNFCWEYRPCEELAGDSLNVFQLDESHVAFYLLDVSGHGARAALLSVAISRILAPLPDQASLVQRWSSDASRLEPTPPSLVAEELNRRFQLDLETYQFFTFFYGVLNTRTHELQYVCAGQTGPIHARAEAAPVNLDNPGIAIGVVPDPHYKQCRLQLEPGDRLYLYSDGLDEARNAQKQQFGKEGVIRSVSSTRDVGLDQSLKELVRAAEGWAGRPFDDDVSAIALETSRV